MFEPVDNRDKASLMQGQLGLGMVHTGPCVFREYSGISVLLGNCTSQKLQYQWQCRQQKKRSPRLNLILITLHKTTVKNREKTEEITRHTHTHIQTYVWDLHSQVLKGHIGDPPSQDSVSESQAQGSSRQTQKHLTEAPQLQHIHTLEGGGEVR